MWVFQEKLPSLSKKKKKKDSHSRERFRVLQQSRVELLFAGAKQGLSCLPVKA